MNIAIVTAVFPPEPVVSALLALDLTNTLAGMGHRVLIICPRPTRPIGSGFRCRTAGGECSTPYGKLIEVDSFTSPGGGLLGRLVESWSFGRNAVKALGRARIDVVYANVWPLFAQHAISRFCNARGIPSVLHIQDVYPEALAGKLPAVVGKCVMPLLLRWDALIAQRSGKIIVLTQRIKESYACTRNVEPSKIMVCPNWQDEERFRQSAGRKDACRRYGVDEAKFSFLYVGNIGPVAGVPLVIEAFQQAAIASAQLIIAGDGTQRRSCEELVRELGVNDVKFISDPSIESIGVLHCLGDVCVLPMRTGAAATSIPSKLCGYMLAGVPVLAAVDADSEAARIVSEARCGWVTDAEDIGALSALMKSAAQLDRDSLRSIGRCGQVYAETRLSRSACVSKVASIVVGSASK